MAIAGNLSSAPVLNVKMKGIYCAYLYGATMAHLGGRTNERT